MAQQEIVKNSFAEITASCAKVVSYFHLASNISPIKRLYIKNLSDEDRENITVRISSEPEFLLPTEITGIRLPRRTTAKFDNASPWSFSPSTSATARRTRAVLPRS